MRIFVILACLLALSRAAEAQTAPLFAAAPASAAQTYAAQEKSVALAVILEALSPIAGVGGFYARDTDRATFLAILSGVAAGAGVGSAFWLIHLDGKVAQTAGKHRGCRFMARWQRRGLGQARMETGIVQALP